VGGVGKIECDVGSRYSIERETVSGIFFSACETEQVICSDERKGWSRGHKKMYCFVGLSSW